MNQEFLATLQKKEADYEAIFRKLHKGVVSTNALIGQDLAKIDNTTREALVTTYKSLLDEELKEVGEAIEKEDKVNLLGELIDVLVVGGFCYYLNTGKVYEYAYSYNDLGAAFDILLKTKSVSTALHYTQAILQQMDCDVDKGVDAILKANLSKFATLEELSFALDPLELEDKDHNYVQEQIKLLEQGGRYGEVSAEIVTDDNGEERYVFWSGTVYGKSNKKYLKAKSFVESNLTDCWK